MKYGNKELNEAAKDLIHNQLVAKGGSGGLIALDKKGNIAMEFNTEGMYRGYARAGKRDVKIYRE
jgi:beta-aspartyl-peptidase (threonine type)